MSRSVAYCVLIRNGEKRKFEDAWAHLKRELIWGPDVLEKWLEEGEQIDWEPEDVDSVALVDFDNKKLVWGEREGFNSAKAFTIFNRLLKKSWQGFSIEDLRPSQLYNLPNEFFDSDRRQLSNDDEDDELEEDDDFNCIETVQEAAEYFEPNPDDDDYEDDEEPAAWLTIVDKHGKARQRKLYELPFDLLSGDKLAVNAVNKLAAVELPPEKSVSEGFCIDIAKKEISIWGPPSTRDKFIKAEESWRGWNVNWIDKGGYDAQCNISGAAGVPMAEEEALSEFLPALLSNKRITFANMMGEVGGSLKKMAIKATGCLTALLCIPILLTGFFMGKLLEAGYAIIALVVIMVIIFKVMEWRVKSKFLRNDITGHMSAKDKAMEEQRSPVAGPINEKERLAKMNELLASCALPSWESLKRQYPEMEESLL